MNGCKALAGIVDDEQPSIPFSSRIGREYLRERVLGFALFLWSILSLIALGASPTHAATGEPRITDFRVAVHPDKTRVVIDLTENLSFNVFALANPDRLVIDLPQVQWSLSGNPLKSGNSVITDVRHGRYQGDRSRIVVDCARAVAIKKAFLLPPASTGEHRLVIDFLPGGGSDQGTEVASIGETVIGSPAPKSPDSVSAPPKSTSTKDSAAKSPSSASKSSTKSSQAARDTKTLAPSPNVVGDTTQTSQRKPASNSSARHVVVIDPGHGGQDPGAISRTGEYEKTITLATARQIRDALKTLGKYRVVLTRDRDIFIPLRKRIAIARAANAEVFISIHANTMDDAGTRGLSIYTLSERASDAEAASLAASENRVDAIQGIDLSHESDDVATMLIDLSQRETNNQSAELASRLIGYLQSETVLLPKTHRFAGFAVLKAPDVPSVLIELGFLSNRDDEELLRSRRHRSKLAMAMAKAIHGYFNREELALGR